MRYGRVPAVRGASVRVEAGEIVGIVGPHGAGKSTTLGTIAGLRSPAKGAIRLAGASIAGLAPETIARSRTPTGSPSCVRARLRSTATATA